MTGIVGTSFGAGLILGLGPYLGSSLAIVVGATVGAVGTWLAARRLLREATACLATLEDGAGPGSTPRGRGRSRTDPVLGFESFDAGIAHLSEILDHSRWIQAEYDGADRLARRLWASMNGSPGSTSSSGRLELAAKGTSQPLSILLDRFRQTAVQINQDVSALEEANERVASGAGDQSEAVSRTATSVEALSDRIDRISHNAGEAADACERARQEARQGLEQVHSVIEGMDRLLNRIEANGRKVRRLGDRSTEIGVIVDLIRGVSSRTDMLALNATIESVRAGEHGRGFAVVAEEIRKLAERTAAATREIGNIVQAIQADTQESISALAEEHTEMQRESQRVHQAGTSLERISQVAEHSARLVDGISRSTNDQVLTTQDLVRAMQRISDVAHQTQERTSQARTFIQALKQSCEPWQRLAATDAVPVVAALAPTRSVTEPPDTVSSSPSVASLRGLASMRRDRGHQSVRCETSQ
jgi:twitching motility protein PilJ